MNPVYIAIAIAAVTVIYFILKTKSLKIKSKRVELKLNELRSERAQLDADRVILDKEVSLNQRRQEDLNYQVSHFHEQVNDEVVAAINRGSRTGIFKNTLVFNEMNKCQPINNERLFSALNLKANFDVAPEVSYIMSGSNGEKYTVTLNSCTCKDFEFNKKPCKHMYRLALSLGMLQIASNIEADLEQLNTRLYQVEALEDRVAKDVVALRKKEEAFALKQAEKISKVDIECKKALLICDEKCKKREKQYIEKCRAYFAKKSSDEKLVPWLSEVYADFIQDFDIEIVDYLRSKHSPALTTASRIEAMFKGEKREWIKRAKAAEYQLKAYESAFPQLLEYKEFDTDDITSAFEASNERPTSEYDVLRRWLSKNEYDKLTQVEKYQLALERYSNRKKSKWEIGIEFERYIGWRYEQQGYKVTYNGALMGVQDLGRDIIAERENCAFVIQCKRWSAKKTIHEKHVFQLYGSVVSYHIEHPSSIVTGLLICTCSLSDTARQYADYLGINIEDNAEIGDYPLVKCNINKATGERIYHLPFDQQYDRVSIVEASGECFAWTVKEAEEKGFRRAMRWKGNNV